MAYRSKSGPDSMWKTVQILFCKVPGPGMGQIFVCKSSVRILKYFFGLVQISYRFESGLEQNLYKICTGWENYFWIRADDLQTGIWFVPGPEVLQIFVCKTSVRIKKHFFRIVQIPYRWKSVLNLVIFLLASWEFPKWPEICWWTKMDLFTGYRDPRAA